MLQKQNHIAGPFTTFSVFAFSLNWEYFSIVCALREVSIRHLFEIYGNTPPLGMFHCVVVSEVVVGWGMEDEGDREVEDREGETGEVVGTDKLDRGRKVRGSEG